MAILRTIACALNSVSMSFIKDRVNKALREGKLDDAMKAFNDGVAWAAVVRDRHCFIADFQDLYMRIELARAIRDAKSESDLAKEAYNYGMKKGQ